MTKVGHDRLHFGLVAWSPLMSMDRHRCQCGLCKVKGMQNNGTGTYLPVITSNKIHKDVFLTVYALRIQKYISRLYYDFSIRQLP